MGKIKLLSDEQLHNILKPYAFKVYKELTELSHSVIEQFYNDYRPKQYKRVYGFYGHGSQNNYLYKPSFEKTKSGYRICFTYSSEYMTGLHRSNDWAFDSGFINGYHGGKFLFNNTPNYIELMSPSPWEIITDYVKNNRFGKGEIKNG